MSDLNSEVKRIKAAELFALAKEILDQGSKAWITISGMSMFPILKEGRDSVELSKCDFRQIKKRDIVLIRRVTGEYVLHRVLKKKADSFYIIGDAQQWIEGPLKPEQLQAVVTKIKRKGHVISCTNFVLRAFVFIWMLLIPFRYRIMRTATRGLCLIRKIFR
jgi:signal peptidase I